MRIRYSISLWNFGHYTHIPSLERAIEHVREEGYGIELWGKCDGEDDIYDERGRKRLKPAVEGMTVSLHTAGATDLDLHKKQIDAAADLGAEVIVLHPGDISVAGTSELDAERAAKAVEYAGQCGVKLALENGPPEFLIGAIEKIDGLGICLDTGHVYNRGDAMAEYLDALKGRLIHLHLQDILTEAETHLPMTGKDHFLPGTGGIPNADWKLMAAALREIDFDGIAVFEIRPRNPMQTALLGKGFIEAMLAE